MSLVSKIGSMTSQFSMVLILSLFSWGYVRGKYRKSPFYPKNTQISHKNELFERSTTLGVLKFGIYNWSGIFKKLNVGILNILIFGRFLWVQNSKHVQNSKYVDFGLPEIGQKSLFSKFLHFLLKTSHNNSACQISAHQVL